MAAIDHTCIIFKNGEWLDKIYDWDEEKEEVVELVKLPFYHNRDGCITKVKLSPLGEFIDIWNEIKWYRDEYDAVYQRAGVQENGVYRLNFYGIMQRLKWIFHVMERVCYRKEVGVYKSEWNEGLRSETSGKGCVEVHIYSDPLNESYVSFYKNGTDTYVVIGGYGHWKNVYAHFMHRGYGDEFEKEMSVEAYHWACDEILKEISESICMGDRIFDWEETDKVLEELRAPFEKFDHYLKEY